MAANTGELSELEKLFGITGKHDPKNEASPFPLLNPIELDFTEGYSPQDSDNMTDVGLEVFASEAASKKEEITHDHRRYLLDHPEVTALLSDYLQAVLFRKPQDVLGFTKEFFQAFLSENASKDNAQKIEISSVGSTSYYDYGSGTSTSESEEEEEEEESDEYYGEWMGEGDGTDNYTSDAQSRDIYSNSNE